MTKEDDKFYGQKNKSKAKQNNHNPDLIFKALFQSKLLVKDLLINIIGKEWVKYLDFDTLELLPTELIKNVDKRITDLSFKIKFKDETLYLILIIEFQSSNDYIIPLRINTYVSLLLEQIVKTAGFLKSRKLPPVFAIIFHNGGKSWTAPKNN